MMTVRRRRATRYSRLFVLVLSVLLFLLPISYSHATNFFCPNDEAFERHLNELLKRNDLVFSGTVENITNSGRLIIIRIKSVFKGEWKNPSITLLASEPFESSSLGFQSQSDEKKDTSRWSLSKRSLVDCFAYGSSELRKRDSRVFFVHAHGVSAVLGTHIQITKFILIKLRNSRMRHMWTGVHTFHETSILADRPGNDGAIVKNRFTTADKT